MFSAIKRSLAAPAAGPLLVFSLLVASCGEPARVTPVFADAGLTKSVLNLETPAANRARVVVFNGGNTSAADYKPRSYPVSIFVDGTKIGSLDPSQAMAFDITPGQHSFYWEELRGRALLHKVEPLTVTLNGGTLTPLQADNEGMTLKIKQGFGPYQLANQGGRQQIQPNIEIVRPSSCPATICLPLN